MSTARIMGLTRIHFPRILGSALVAGDGGTDTLGWALFLGNGVLLANGYRALIPHDTGNPVLRGAALGLLHGAIAATGARLGARLHPRPRAGGLPRSGKPGATDLAVLCSVHVLYGALLGVLFRRRRALPPAHRTG